MTFTEAAVEVLRRSGKPLHYNEIAEVAIKENLLSHVGQDPHVVMGQRLAAMAKREEERRVVAIAPDGTFALVEWTVPAELIVEPVPPPPPPEDDGKAYRPREREPRPISPQARRRIDANSGIEDTTEQPERRDRDRDRERGKHQFPPPSEVVFEWLAQRGSGAPLAEIAGDLVKRGMISEGLLSDLPSLAAALLEDNRRRTEAGRKPAFICSDERASLVEFPPLSAVAELASIPSTGAARPASAASLVAEARRATVRALRARLADLDTAGFEHVCAALLEKMGMKDLRIAKRSKEGPLYLARQRRGVSDLRVAVRLVRGKREITRGDVQELRKDLSHYSAQMALLLAPGEAGRDSRTEASAAAQPPVALYAGEALADELVSLRVGVNVQVVEISDVDEAFFLAATKAQARPGDRDRRDLDRSEAEREGSVPAEAPAAPAESPQAAPAAAAPVESQAPAAQGADDGRRGDRNRPPQGRRDDRRDEKPKLLSPADQAWGQPAGTPKRGALFAPQAPEAEPNGAQPAPVVAEPVAAAPVEASEAAAPAAETPVAQATTEAAPEAVAAPAPAAEAPAVEGSA
jgi:hypothetical protein